MFEMFIVILYFAIIIGLVYTFINTIITLFELYLRMPKQQVSLATPAVTILKPLKGQDDRLEENLRSFFELDWPNYELLFGVNYKDDPAIPIVKQLQRKYPHIDSRLIIDSRHIGLNPKINNLHNLYRRTKYEYILISDSNIRVQSDYLHEMMKHMLQPNVGLVTTTFRGTNARSIGSILENLHLNTFVVGNTFTVNDLFRIPITIGKSMLIRKTIVKRLNGFSKFADYLAEDHLLGVYIRKAGMKISHSTHIIDNVNQNWSMKRFINRHMRWAKMRKNLNLLHYAVEILANPIFIALPYMIIRGDSLGVIHFAFIALTKILLDRTIAMMIHSDLKWYHYLLIPFKDIIIGIIWLLPFVDNKINWRGSVFRIKRGTRLLPLTR
jgi:ceramide glucosyltransferase